MLHHSRTRSPQSWWRPCNWRFKRLTEEAFRRDRTRTGHKTVSGLEGTVAAVQQLGPWGRRQMASIDFPSRSTGHLGVGHVCTTATEGAPIMLTAEANRRQALPAR